MINVFRYLICIFIICLLTNNVNGEKPIYDDIFFTPIIPQNDLLSEQVIDIIEDKYGFIWFATANGLNRFDGVDVKKFYHNKADTTTISNDDILCLYNGRNGDLWIGTYNGLNRFDFETGNFIRYNAGKAPNGLINGAVFTIYEDKDNFLWIGTESGLNVLNLKNNKIQHFSHLDNFNNTGLLTILEDDIGRMWFGTWSTGLHLLIDKMLINDTLQLKFNQFTVSEADGGNKIWTLFSDDSKNIWIGTFGAGLYKLHIKDHQKIKLNKNDVAYIQYSRKPESVLNKVTSNWVTHIAQDCNGYIWVTTLDGVDLLNPNKISTNHTFTKTFSNNFRTDGSLLHNETWSVYEDKNKIIWIATSGGVSKYDPHKKNFNRYYPLKEHPSERILTIVTDSLENHWLGTEHFGLIKYNPNTGIEELFSTKQNETPFYDKSVNQLKIDYDNLWISTNVGLSQLNLKTEQLNNYTFFQSEDTLKEHPIFTRNILIDSQKNLWISTLNGVIFVDCPSMDYKIITKEKYNLLSNDIFDVEEDKNGAIWIATFSGLMKLIVKDNDFEVERTFTMEANAINDTNSIISSRIYSLLIDDDNLWLATINGLSQININSNKVINHNLLTQGSKVIVGLNKDDAGNLWLMCKKTISKYNPETGNQILFTLNDGLHSENFELNSQFKSKTSELFFPGAGGYTSFYPDSISLNEKMPEIFVTDFKVFNESLPTEENVLFADEIDISYDQNFIGFEYMALNYHQSEKNQYQYMLEGFDEDWIYAGHKKTAIYTNLDGGDYTFKVRGSNNDGLWNLAGSSIKLNVTPPFWETWTFRILTVIAFLLLGLSILKWRTAHLRKRSLELLKFNKSLNTEIKVRQNAQKQLLENKQKLHTLVEELKRSNNNLQNFAYIASHDLNAPLRTVYSFIALLKRKHEDKLDASGNLYIDQAMFGLNQMRNLVESLLNFSKLGASKEGYKNANVKTIIEGKLFNLQTFIQEKNATINLEINNDLSVFCEPEEIGIVFNNLINNGIKYNKTENPIITVKQYEEEKFWKFSITDNGIGIEQKDQHKIFALFERLHGNSEFEGSGIGLSICQKIITIHKGKIWIESKNKHHELALSAKGN